MIAFGRAVNTVVVAVLLLGPIGCRDKTPTPSQNHNLSLNDTPLLPTGSPTKDASLADAQQNRADWVAFRNPDEVTAAPTATEKTTAAAGEPAADLTADVKTELQEIVTDYNDVSKDGDIAGLLEYYVEQQQTAVESYLASAKSMGETIRNIRNALPKDAPDAMAPILSLLDRLATASSLTLSLDEIEKADGQRIVGRVTSHEGTQPAMSDVEFVLVDDEWFLQLGQAEMVANWTANAKLATEALAPLVAEAPSGGDGAELLAKISDAAKSMLVAVEPTPTDGAKGDGAKEAVEDSNTKDDDADDDEE